MHGFLMKSFTQLLVPYLLHNPKLCCLLKHIQENPEVVKFAAA